MRRIVVLALALLLTGISFPERAEAVTDSRGPSCVDIQNRTGSYEVLPRETAPTGRAQFHFEFTIAAAPCDQVTYFLYVADSNGGSRTATYPATAGNDPLVLCDTARFCYNHDYGSTAASPPPPLFLLVTGESKIKAHSADTTPTVDYALCDASTADDTYPDCPIPDNSWDQ